MKGKLFLLALVAALSFSTVQAQVKMENAVKTGKFSHQVTKQALNARYLNVPTLNARADVPAGYALVTLSAGDIWGDGSGYQMLLDADANAFGTIIPETGALTTGGDVPAVSHARPSMKVVQMTRKAGVSQSVIWLQEKWLISAVFRGGRGSVIGIRLARVIWGCAVPVIQCCRFAPPIKR